MTLILALLLVFAVVALVGLFVLFGRAEKPPDPGDSSLEQSCGPRKPSDELGS
jgi:hypothetical protein